DNLDSGGATPKAIFELLESRPLFDAPHLQLIEFLSSYYMTSIGEAFRNVMPGLARVESHRMYRVAGAPDLLAQVASTTVERDIIAALARRPMTLRQLDPLGESSEVKAAVGRLVAEGRITAREAMRGRHRKQSADRTEWISESSGPQAHPANYANGISNA